MKENSFLFSTSGNSGLSKARARFLTQAIQLEEQGPPRLVSLAAMLTLALLVAVIAWSSITKVSEKALAPGKVIPAGLNHTVQHLEGGLVMELLVRDGDPVKKGDLLLRFDPTATSSELEQIRIRKVALDLEAERLAALVESREPNFSDTDTAYASLIAKQRTVYHAQRISHERGIQVAESQISQRETELIQQLNAVESLTEETKLFQEQVDIRLKLEGKNVISRTELLSTKSRLAEAQRDLRRAKDSVSVARSGLEEAKQHKNELEAAFFKELELEAGRVATEIMEVSQTMVRLQDRLQRMEIRSSVDGIVQGLSLGSGSAVVEPGQLIMELVPTDDELVVEARVSPADIGHVKQGQPSDIKIDSYDPAKFGSVKGQVRRISANTYLNEKSQPYYRVEISLEKDHLGKASDSLRIIPGMTVMADIITGSKTILDYLLKPINRGMDNAFCEG